MDILETMMLKKIFVPIKEEVWVRNLVFDVKGRTLAERV
jgi:hypothetical protein